MAQTPDVWKGGITQDETVIERVGRMPGGQEAELRGIMDRVIKLAGESVYPEIQAAATEVYELAERIMDWTDPRACPYVDQENGADDIDTTIDALPLIVTPDGVTCDPFAIALQRMLVWHRMSALPDMPIDIEPVLDAMRWAATILEAQEKAWHESESESEDGIIGDNGEWKDTE